MLWKLVFISVRFWFKVYEVLVLEILILLLEISIDDLVEVAVGFLKEFG